ncbi:MAG: lytic murein transglycosylase [Patescibacteria group bacterium]
MRLRRYNLFFICTLSLTLGLFLDALTTSLWLPQQLEAASLTPEQRVQLQSQLDGLEKEIDAQQSILDAKRTERVSLERDVSILTAQITQAKLSIRARDLTIQGLAADIKAKENTIDVLSDKIDQEKTYVAELLNREAEIYSASPIEIYLTRRSLSSLFEDADQYGAIREALRTSYTKIGEDRKATQVARDALQDKKDEQAQLLSIQKLQQKRLVEQEAEKKKILAVTKGVESAYQNVLKEKTQSANAIRAQLFQLQGSAAIPFGKALEYAKAVEKKTGVRAAFILGIITTESNLGQNVGKGNWRVDMKAPRDTVPFLEICKELGLDPDKMPVSAKQWYGYGGAMGPAQFIPSTWVLFKDRISAATGNKPPNPWDPEDAFMASGLLLKDNGAAKGTRAAERLAATRYLAGWVNATKPAYAFYGNEVLAYADKYQAQINILGAN